MNWYVVLYLAAALSANLIVVEYGPSVTILTGFLFIGLDLTSRDKLHDAWEGKNLWLKMFALIATGSLISWIVNRDAGQIAIASLIAFMLAGLSDAVIYHWLRHTKWFTRVTGSNAVSALVDSIAFPTIAFGSFLPMIVLGQYVAKVSGGFVWAWIISKFKKD